VDVSCLIVDDNAAFVDAARTLLERERGTRVAGVAFTGADAIRQVEALHPDVVLVDVYLGEESGLELARRLVEGGASEATVILISTSPDAANLAATSPAAGFIPKAKLSARAIQAIVDQRFG
jgi:DNA-binding NarL/FixJ family response regulator